MCKIPHNIKAFSVAVVYSRPSIKYFQLQYWTGLHISKSFFLAILCKITQYLESGIFSCNLVQDTSLQRGIFSCDLGKIAYLRVAFSVAILWSRFPSIQFPGTFFVTFQTFFLEALEAIFLVPALLEAKSCYILVRAASATYDSHPTQAQAQVLAKNVKNSSTLDSGEGSFRLLLLTML